MTAPTRRQLLLVSGAVAAALAGCSGGGDTGTKSGKTVASATETSGPQVPGGDTTLTLGLKSHWADDFETVTVDIDRIEFVGRTDTDDVVIQLEDTGLDLTSLPEDGKTYFEDRPFPSGSYTAARIHLTVQEAVRTDGSNVRYEDESPVDIDFRIGEDTIDITKGGWKKFTFSLGLSTGSDSGTFTLAPGYAALG